MAKVWQHPFLNVFRHFQVGEWKRSTKEGDVAPVTDKTLKCTVYRIRGPVSAGSYIQLPRTSTQSLGLTGRFLYVLFKPLPAKHFIIHLDVATEDSQVIRVSFSNLFKEFKSTATWLQFPFICEAGFSLKEPGGVAPSGPRWTCLQLDLRDVLLLYLNRRYSHLKSVRLCASLLVKSLYTSDLCFEPAVSTAEARRAKLSVVPVPREMAFPVPKGESWYDHYVHIRFPRDSFSASSKLVQKSSSPPEADFLGRAPKVLSHPVAFSNPLQDRVLSVVQAPSEPRPLPEVSVFCEHSELPSVNGPSDRIQEPSAGPEVTGKHAAGRGVHVPTPERTVVPVAPEGVAVHESLLPDPVLRLKGVIGFGGHTTKWVSALALDGSGLLLASAQARPPSMLRLWDFQTGECLSLFQSPAHALCSLSFSDGGALLCGVGRDCHGRTVVLAWGTAQVGRGGEAVLLAKAHTGVDIQAFEVASFDESRMASCGQGSVRLWRLRGGELRSCPVDLGEHRVLELTGLAFGQAQDGHMLYVCSRSGHILEIDLRRMAVRHARRLLPARPPDGPASQKQAFSSGPGISISSLSVSQARCAVGSEDGYLRLWPLDFSSVLLEAEHEGPVTSVCISPDGQRVLSATSSGLLGFLDVPSQEYSVLVRSHTAPVLALATEGSRSQLATVSQDHTVRVWDLVTLQQLYDLRSPEEAPCTVTFHPTRPALFCGFSSGAVRSFSLEAAEVLVEHRCHRGPVTGLATSPDGSLLFSSCSSGTLAQYQCVSAPCRVLRVAANVVCRDAHPTPNALAVSGDGRLLAFVGPSKYVVTVMNAACLEELLQIDVSALDPASSCLDSAVAICFDPGPLGHLLLSTSSHTVTVLDTTSGRVVRELPGVHAVACPSLALSRDARFLLMAADRAIKVWDYVTKSCPSCQVYIGHSEPVHAVGFSPDQQQLLSVGDAIFLWDILGPPERSPPGSAGDSPAAAPTYKTSLDARQLEDTVCGANGLPRQQVPEPSPASPLQPGVCVGSLKGDNGAFSLSDEEGVSEESHSPARLCQASCLPMLVKEASRAGDGVWGSPGGPWGLSMGPHPHSWSSAHSVSKAQVHPSARPDCYRHFLARYKTPLLAKSASVSNTGVERLLLKVVVGYNGNGRANVVWKPDTGFFAYTCGCLVVVEDLHSGAQRHWLGHPEEISTLALSHGAQVLASASGSCGTASRCHICIWDVPGGSCRYFLSYHRTAVQALAFSPDDELLVTLGDYGDRTLALWSTATYEVLSSTRLPEPVHGVAFNPWDASELVCVGQGAVSLWLLQRRGTDVSLQGHRVPIPEEVRAGELTSLCYGPVPLLYCGSNAGQICVWDTSAGRCFLAWEADDGEIGVLLCSGARLVSGSNTRRLRLWAVGAVAELQCEGSRARSSSVFMERELTLDGAVVSAVFHDSMDMGVVGTTAGTLWYVSWAEGTSTRLISGHRSKPQRGRLAGSLQVNEVVFSPSASHWATCSDDGSVRVWSLASMELLIQFQVLNQVPGALRAEPDPPPSPAWSLYPPSVSIPALGLGPCSPRPGECPCLPPVGPQSCLCLAWSPPSCRRPEQQQVAAGYSDGTLRVFSVTRIAMELKMHPHRAALTALAYSADGQTILSGDKDGLVAVSRPCTGMTFHVLSDHQGALISTIQSTSKEYGDFGSEGADLWLAASSDQRISIWAADWPRGCCELVDWLSSPSPTLTEAPSHPPPCLVAFCPWDRALLVCAGLSMHPELVFYNLHQKQVVERIPLPFFAVSLSLSPRAHLVAVGFAERVLRLVDCQSGATRDLAGHDDVVQLCRFAPSAQLLFSVAHGDILVWEVMGHRASEWALSSGPPPD
ncbi:WD repeat-containing protein 90-like isoform X4 [Mustela lutreola]|uniref:WD repeat-containing protein 90-like isoform X4 n=1 Tax=Mustela lutreola TaxID=9666 RepID=UPI0027973BA3|nr:WD repeat-containing protein 90-like isoform X4 [Mustela lutreola]